MATPTNNTGIPDYKLAQYLVIALKQRERALAKFTQDYGAEHPIVKECQSECGQMTLAIATLQTKK